MTKVSRGWVGVSGVALLMLASTAHAELIEPGDAKLVVPRPVSAGEMGDAQALNPGVVGAGSRVSLQALFAYRGEPLDALTDAKTEPSTFTPQASISATLVLRGGACKLEFAWYNAIQSGGAPPAANELYSILDANDATVYAQAAFAPLAIDGPWTLKTFTVPNIHKDARYLGGDIGFALVGSGAACSQTKYSQRSLNQLCTGCSPVEPFITTIVYASKKLPGAYYLAFEDLPLSPAGFSFNNDGDFNDFVFLIEGVALPGACLQAAQPSDETCDGLDNDCDGAVDEGAKCPGGQTCDAGSCIDPAAGGSGSGGAGGDTSMPADDQSSGGGPVGGSPTASADAGAPSHAGANLNDDGEAGAASPADGLPASSSGCGCRAAGSSGTPSLVWLGFAVVLGLAAGRRAVRLPHAVAVTRTRTCAS
jgi:hypothetical protein